MRRPIEMWRVGSVEGILPGAHASHTRALLVRGAPLLGVGAVSAALVETVRRAAEGAAGGIGAPAGEPRWRPAASGAGGRVVAGVTMMGVCGAEVAVVGGALGGGGEDAVGFRDADEALGRVRVRGVAVRVVEFRECVEGPNCGLLAIPVLIGGWRACAHFLISASVASGRTFRTS